MVGARRVRVSVGDAADDVRGDARDDAGGNVRDDARDQARENVLVHARREPNSRNGACGDAHSRGVSLSGGHAGGLVA